MKTFFKWLLIVGAAGFVLLIAAALIVPKFIDIKQYKPMVEKVISDATGRPFSVGDEIELSLFPWAVIKLTDVRLGNPDGYGSKDMVFVDNFEVRLKVLPLLSKQIEAKTFILDKPVIYLEKLKNGKANWEMGKGKKSDPVQKKEPAAKSGQGLPIESLQVDTFSIVNGRLIFIDQQAGMKKEISDFNLGLSNISLDKSIGVKFAAKVDGQPISMDGDIGPIGKQPGKGVMEIDLTFKALEELTATFKGSVTDAASPSNYDFNIDVSSFSPRKLMAALGQAFPVKTSDPEVLDKVGLKVKISGAPKQLSVRNGSLLLDDSTLEFSASINDASKPDLSFKMSLDEIDMDRYLPEPAKSGQSAEPAPSKSSPKSKTDYNPLRKLVLDGTIKAGKIKAHGALAENINIHIKAKNGVITIDPFDLDLYQGTLASKVGLDVRKSNPKTSINLSANGIQAGPLLKDALQKELIEGTLNTDIQLAITGDTPEMIKQTLNGEGELFFTDGAIIGIDIAGTIRNAQAKLGMAEAATEKPRTDFAELAVPFTAKNGVVNTKNTRLVSPLLRIITTGNVFLPKEELDLRIDPKVVATLKGQGDTKQRSGLMVPLLITGSFASPKIRPDLKGMIGGGVGKGLDPEALKQQLLGGGTKKEGQAGDKTDPVDPKKQIEEKVEEQVKGLIPGLFR